MTARGYAHGYPIEYNDTEKQWVYSDTKEIVKDNPRLCRRCKESATPEGYDTCLGHLPGVKAACCGHGVEGEGYILFENDKRISL